MQICFRVEGCFSEVQNCDGAPKKENPKLVLSLYLLEIDKLDKKVKGLE